MSQLSPFVRVLRTLSRSFEVEAGNVEAQAEEFAKNEERDLASVAFDRSHMLDAFRSTFARAASDLEQQIARDLARGPGRVEDDVTAGGGS